MNRETIASKVAHCYRQHDLNCATTSLKLFAEQYQLDLSEQVINAAVGMHGAGKYRAQCGLVEGPLMFLGIAGRQAKMADEAIIDHCFAFARKFEETFGSLLCRDLRPQGFAPDQPPHLCEDLTCRAIAFSMEYLREALPPPQK